MDETTIIAIVIGIIGAILFGSSKKKNKDGKITDKFVDKDSVLDHLDEFKPKLNPKLKFGFTEKSIQKQLCDYLREYYEHVNTEYGIGGLNAIKIDIDVGEGKVGIELKLASKLFKTSEFNRLAGQLRQYTNSKYDEDNLILGIIGTKDDRKETSWIRQIKDLAEEYEAEVYFIEVDKKEERT
ncbi:MAG: hypothetical protein J7F05_08650 [Trichodesmium erythraeum GBRTRLIN201]|nr:hypothetical protein [Trichodesmium erythraeum GBRTRLIN201]